MKLLTLYGHNNIKEIKIIIGCKYYYLSPFLININKKFYKYQNKLNNLLKYNDLNLLLTTIETYEIINRLEFSNKLIDKDNVYIYDISGKLIYGRSLETNKLSDDESLLLFNINFDIENTVKIIKRNYYHLYDMLELIECIGTKYYFNIEELKKKYSKINFYKLFNLDEDKMPYYLKEIFIKLIEKNKNNDIDYGTQKCCILQ